jgi:flagellar motor switch protein FliM
MADPTKGFPADPGDALSQNDIDALLAQAAVAEEKKPPVFRAGGERFPAGEPRRIEAFDFTNPVIIDELVMRPLFQRHEEYAGLVSARLSIFLRMDFGLKLQRVAAVAYHRFIDSVPNPSHVLLFKAEPLPGVGVLDINTRLGLTVVDRMLGGKGHSVKPHDHLTEIETNLLDDILLVMLEEWCRMWGVDQRLSISVVGHESGGRYLQTSARDTIMFVAAFECALGDCTDTVQIAIPLPSIDGIVRGMGAARLAGGAEAKGAERRSSWRSAYNAIPVRLAAEWDACEISLRQILDLSTGTIVRLPRDIVRDTRVRLTGVTKFVGEVGIEAGRLAIRIDQKVSPEDL